MQTQITAALNTRLAANPHLKINMEDILNILQKILNPPNPPTNQDHLQLLKIDASKPLLFKGKQCFEGQHNTFPPYHKPFSQFNSSYTSSLISKQLEGWKNIWLTNQNPCFYCGEAGHWAPDFPARTKEAQARMHLSQRRPSVASLEAVLLLEKIEALLDLGETNSVVGNLSLFINAQHIDMRLLVASSHQFNVDAIGDVKLTTPEGPLIVHGALYCKAICGVVLSLGHLISQQILVAFIDNQFILHQNS
ncbi:hypothetical protein O181_117905 [Austropuccinia psidii MF-1]|uniref:CCHC-type domain-containing protein n=1 Tax=Austropuccinia psidii MF-1 TaxID=1389203 RepID=A0A9Q3KB90_9BASI|nr:hypothetical protein [Austropuccinia psidii MF-1]